MNPESGIIKKGVAVNVYEDPITMLTLEGKFIPTEFVKSSKCHQYKLEIWYGFFEGEHNIVLRKISVALSEG